MKAYQIFCPACGATVSVDEGQMKAFCTYCGSQLQIDDQIERKEIIYRTVDEAAILKEQNRIAAKNKNIRLMISREVFNNLNTLKDYNSKINMEDKSILMKPECSDTAWKSLYYNLPEAFGENELGFLIKFYEKIEELLDDKSWLKFTNAKPIGAFENYRMIVRCFTEKDLEEINTHKKFIKEIINSTLLLERNLSFLESNF